MRPLEGVRILLVEDDDDTREITRLALEARGALMVCARDAAEGLKELEARTPDIVLSDIAMPGTDGHTFLKRVRALPRTKGGKIPAVAITAYTSREARLSSREAGFHYHLAKPYDIEKLTEILMGLARIKRS